MEPWEITKRQATSAGRWEFEHILKLCRYKRQLGGMFLPLLIVLRNSVVPFLNPLGLTLFLIIFSSSPISLFMLMFPLFASITVSNMKLLGERLLPLEIVKPLSRKKLFLSEYLSYYFPLLVFFSLFWLSGPLRPYNPLHHWLESIMRDGPFIPLESSLLIAGSFFLISFLVLSIRRARHSTLFLCLGLAPTMILSRLSQIIGLLPILTIFSTLTVLFLIIAFRLDCRKDI